MVITNDSEANRAMTRMDELLNKIRYGFDVDMDSVQDEIEMIGDALEAYSVA